METKAEYKAGKIENALEKNGAPVVTQQEIYLHGLGKAAATWISMAAVLEPGMAPRQLTICVLRMIGDRPGAVFVGQAVKAPNEIAEAVLGRRVALVRAVQAMLPDQKQLASHIARKALWVKENNRYGITIKIFHNSDGSDGLITPDGEFMRIAAIGEDGA